MAFVPNLPDGRWHGYCLLSEAPLGWDNSQRDNAKAALKSNIGRQSGPAHLITHGRANLNNTAWMYESSYTEQELTKEYQAQVLADELGLTYAAVFAKIQFTIFAEGGTWEQSRDAANQYIADNRAEWEEEV
jgi:hypothetical protein